MAVGRDVVMNAWERMREMIVIPAKAGIQPFVP